jgi:CubicO group peptidase (beta-lactamase class C family)
MNSECRQICSDLQAHIDCGDATGMAISVVHNGSVILEKAFGTRWPGRKRKLKADDVFFLASCSKPVAATVITAMSDHGKLPLDTPVSEWIPQLADIHLAEGGNLRAPTLRELLSHTGGAVGNATGNFLEDPLPPAHPLHTMQQWTRPLADAVDNLLQHPWVSRPGSCFSYSGAGYCVAGRTTEIAGQDHFDFLSRDNLFAPLDLRRTFYRANECCYEHRIPIYQKTDTGYQRRYMDHTAPSDGFILVGGGLYSTLHDMGNFLLLHLGEGTFGKMSFISATAMHDMRRNQTGGLKDYGLGWFLQEYDDEGLANIITHTGVSGACMWINFREQLGIFFVAPMPEGKRWRTLKDVVIDTVRSALA